MDYKGVGVVFVRTALRRVGASAEARVLEQLSAEERRLYEDVTASQWVPIEFATRLFELAAPIVHPGKPLPLRLMGRDLARDNMNGVYRVFLRVLSPQFILEQTARLWRTYHRHGSSHVEQIGPREVDVVACGYAKLPERFRECMCGWIAETLELSGAKQVFVSKTDDDPERWRWRIRWQ